MESVEVLVTQLCPTHCDPVGWSPTRFLCPWDSPGKNAGVGCHSLLQGVFLTPGWNLGLAHCRQTLSQLSRRGGVLNWRVTALHAVLLSPAWCVQRPPVCTRPPAREPPSSLAPTPRSAQSAEPSRFPCTRAVSPASGHCVHAPYAPHVLFMSPCPSLSILPCVHKPHARVSVPTLQMFDQYHFSRFHTILWFPF